MTTEVFVPYKPHAITLRVVEQANTIIAEECWELDALSPTVIAGLDAVMGPAPSER
jgi:hypothetical protein